MTTPTPAPAPMTAEQLDRMRKWVAAIPNGSYEQHTTGAGACRVLLAYIDALTARVATLEAQLKEAREKALLEAADMCARFDDCGPSFIAQRLRDTAARVAALKDTSHD